MKISFKNLAHISEGVFEKNNFSIIVGDNGSGKTLLLETMMYIENYFDNAQFPLISELFSKVNQKMHLDLDLTDLFSELNESLTNKQGGEGSINRIGDPIDIYLKCEDPDSINFDISETIHSKKGEIINGVNNRIFKGTCKDFDFDFYDFPLFDEGIRIYSVTFYLFDNSLIFTLNSTFNSIVLNKYKSSNLDEIVVLDEMLNKGGINFLNLEMLSKDIEKTLKNAIIEDLLSDYFELREALYLPSERSTYMYEGYRKMLDNFKLASSMRYSEEHFVREYLRAVNFNKDFTEQVKFSAELINLFGGVPVINEDGEIGSIKIGNVNLDKILFSTKLNRAIPYILFEQRQTKYAWAVVEEPEAHMSLRTMNYLIDYLIKINSKTKLTITTHSDVFFGKLINALIKNNVKDLAVFEMVQNGETTMLKKIEKNEYGYKIALFKEELEDLFKETIEMQDGEL